MEPTTQQNRFSLLCHKMLTENKRIFLITLAGYLGACIAGGLWLGWCNCAPTEGACVLYAFGSWLACMVAASMMFRDFRNKQGRIAALMTPASISNKFWIRFIVVMPCTLLLTLIGYFVYMYSVKLSFYISNDIWQSIYIPFIELANSTQEIWLSILGLIASVLFNYAIYMFGSIHWPRYSFIKTVGVMVTLSMGMFAMMSGVNCKTMADSIYIAANVLSIAAAMVLFYFTYRKLKHSTL